MKQYISLLKSILKEGLEKEDRTGVGTISTFGNIIKFNLQDGFPLVTIRKMHIKGIIGELLWFMQGSTNVEKLREITFGKDSNKKTIWDANYQNQGIQLGYSGGELGPIYGSQWRSWNYRTETGKLNHIDQLQNAVNTIINNPESRRILVNSWHVDQIDQMALPPCHYGFQFNVEGEFLDLAWNQR